MNPSNSETHVKALTDVCESVCMFIKSITTDNTSKDEQIDAFKTKIDESQVLCSDLKLQLKKINEQVKTLASLLRFTINQDHSTIDILTQLIASLSPSNNTGNIKKRKLFSSYSPLKLSLKDKTEMNEGTSISKYKCSKVEKENKSSQNESKNVWKLQIKVDGKPSDLLKKSKQTTLNLLPQKDKVSLDITTLNNLSSKTPNLNLNTFNHEASSVKKNDSNVNTCIHDTSIIDDSCNMSISHFNKKIKSSKHVMQTIKQSTSCESHDQLEKHNQSCDETICSPINIPISVIQNKIASKKQNKISNRNVLNNCDIKLDLSNVQNDLPNNNLKKDPVKKCDERKLVKSSTSHSQPEKCDELCDETVCSPINIPIKNEVASKQQNKIFNRNVLNNFDVKLDLNDVQNDLPNYNFKEDPVRKRNERKLLNGWDCEDCRKFYEANNDNPVEAKNAMNHFSKHRSVKHQHHAPTPPGFWDPT